jgi:deoxyadenosine/deoxycytidine kinase
MPYIVSLQGGMASGKTTAARYIREHVPDVTVSYENPAPVLAEVVAAGLSKFVLDDFIQIQRMFIRNAVERYYGLLGNKKVVMDLGPEEIEFYTLFFPQSIGMDWDMERLLHAELTDLRRCRLDGILFLDARNETLRRRAEADPTRRRNSFVHYMNHMHRHKKEWFLQSLTTTFLQVDGRTAVKWLK